MSQRNVDIVLALHQSPQTDIARQLRDDGVWSVIADRLSQVLAPDFECTAIGYLDAEGDVFHGAVWTVGNGKITRAEFYADRAAVLPILEREGPTRRP